MNETAIVRTSGDVLNVRSSPNGEIVDTLPNGTRVTITGSPVTVGNWNWVSIGPERWVAMEFLTFVAEFDPLPPTTPDLAGPKVVATQTLETIAGGLRVYETQLIDGENRVVDQVRCISGRVGLQDPSPVPESQTPIPYGVYTFDYPGYVDYDAPGEFGGAWSPVTPTFETSRGGFGIHYDPSAFADNYNTGTAGCLATPTIAEREIMTDFIVNYKPIYLVIQKDH
ncbi:MAG: SH3 domain-containing protein [Cyanobacteria bacterium J06592_8]